MNWLDWIIARCLKAGRPKVLPVVAALIAIIVWADWANGNHLSLGVLYILPTIIGAAVIPPVGIALMALIYALLRALFGIPLTMSQHILHFTFDWVCYFGCGLFITALVRNRELVARHLDEVRREQGLRREAEEQLRVLVESSPAAILTIGSDEKVVAANRAANALLMIPDGMSLQGRDIGQYLPVLADALRIHAGPEGFRTTAQCQGRRDNNEIFLAQTWFSTYAAANGKFLAAIVVDSSEEMKAREEMNFQQLITHNRIAAAAVSHEVRNLCAAISILSSRIEERHRLSGEEDFHHLVELLRGLETIASFDLHSRVQASLEQVPLQKVLDNLRIVIEPDWQDGDGVIRWNLSQPLPCVLADPNGLLQAFLNLARNSHRAVENSPDRTLTVAVAVEAPNAIVRISDSGPGITSPERLFLPFQPGADGSGLGLYISRAIVRSYGGDLRHESQPSGSCFAVVLQLA